MPRIIAAMSRFCSGLTLCVVTEAVVLVFFLFLLRRSFAAYYIAGYFSIGCWVSQLSHDHSSFPYHLMGFLMSTPFLYLFLFHLPLPPRPPRPPLPQPPLPSNRLRLLPLLPIPSEFTCRLCPYLSDDVWIAGKRCDITVDKYLEIVLNIAMWLYLQILT